MVAGDSAGGGKEAGARGTLKGCSALCRALSPILKVTTPKGCSADPLFSRATKTVLCVSGLQRCQ